ncbi:MAG: M20 family metallopeptidase [Alphaproteobacteria bacterium]|nr:M20 family metallopeptidase [Alphaproteobacteria bacterium]
MDVTGLKRDACAAIDAMAGELLSVSHDIHANPELNFAERFAAKRLGAAVTAHGLPLVESAYFLETAFMSEFGRPEPQPTIAILSEYDALPGIGHACGHNIIASAGLGAILGLSKLQERLPGRIRYLGTPAEEGGGGKELMAQAGAFEGLDAAMMVHPSSVELVTMPCLALSNLWVTYHGLSAHASAMPHRGINALDALVAAYQAIAALRQHIKPTERIHGIITDGGQAPNIVPEKASGYFLVRAHDARDLAALKKRVQGCFEAGAAATGARLEMSWGKVDYLDLKTSWPMAHAYKRNAEALGRSFLPLEKLPPGLAGSTDMGNISYRVPSIHPMIAVAPPDVVIHNPEFTAWAKSDRGDKAVIDGAKAMAMTALDLLCDDALRGQTRAEFEASGQDSRAVANAAFHTDGRLATAGCGCC